MSNNCSNLYLSCFIFLSLGLFLLPLSTDAEDPESIEATIAKIKKMREAGALNDKIASYLSGVVDRRLSSDNTVSYSGGDSYGLFLPGAFEMFGGEKSEWSKRFEHFNNEREYFGKTGSKGVIRRSDLTERAYWAWNNQVGNCNEAQSISYYVLSQAGIPARPVTSDAGNGHDFVVIGCDPGFQANDPTTWGPWAMVVDGWTGDALTPQEAFESWHHSNRGKATMSDRTNEIVKPQQDKLWEEMEGKGILFIVVSDKKTKKPIKGVNVQVYSEQGNISQTTSAKGFVTFTLPVGNVQIHIPATFQKYTGASTSAQIKERRRKVIKISLKPAFKTPAPAPTPEPKPPILSEPKDILLTGTNKWKTQNGGSGKIKLTIDLATGKVTGSISGRHPSVRGTMATLRGQINGTYTGDAESGSMNGSVKYNPRGIRGGVRIGSDELHGTLENAVIDGSFYGGRIKKTFRYRLTKKKKSTN